MRVRTHCGFILDRAGIAAVSSVRTRHRFTGEKPAVSWILNIEDAGGVRDIVSGEQTDELESPYEYAGEYDGEIYFADGRNQVIGHPVSFKNELDFALEPTLTEVTLQEEMEVKEAKQTGKVTILDFGQNFAGIVEINPSFLTNETITIRHGEILNADGSLYTSNCGKQRQLSSIMPERKRKNTVRVLPIWDFDIWNSQA